MELETSRGELWKSCRLWMGQNIGNSVVIYL